MMDRPGSKLKMFAASLIFLLSGSFVGGGRLSPATASPVVALTPASARSDGAFEIVRGGKYEGVIVRAEKAREFMRAFSGIEEKEFWTPDKNGVRRLEQGIAAYLKRAAAQRSPQLWSKLASYKRQYVGVVRNGRRMIFANFFCQAIDSDWKSAPVVVEDGGDCFFNLLYDPTSATFVELRINGDA